MIVTLRWDIKATNQSNIGIWELAGNTTTVYGPIYHTGPISSQCIGAIATITGAAITAANYIKANYITFGQKAFQQASAFLKVAPSITGAVGLFVTFLAELTGAEWSALALAGVAVVSISTLIYQCWRG